MKLRFPVIAAFTALLALTACGSDVDDGRSAIAGINNPSALEKTDIVLGTGDEAVAGKVVTVQYSLWLYDSRLSENKGAFLESGPFTYTMGTKQVITGFEEGMAGMKVGGTRRIYIPASMGYGEKGSNSVPPNWGLVYDLTLLKVAAPPTSG